VGPRPDDQRQQPSNAERFLQLVMQVKSIAPTAVQTKVSSAWDDLSATSRHRENPHLEGLQFRK